MENLGKLRREKKRVKERKERNKQDVSSFRFTVVVGEIWLRSYSTLRTEQEEEEEIYMVRTALLDFRATTQNHAYSAEGCPVKDWARREFSVCFCTGCFCRNHTNITYVLSEAASL